MIQDYPIGIGGHKFTKTNLVTKKGPKGMYDEYTCEQCGMKGRSYKFGRISLSKIYGKNIFKCKVLIPKRKIQITKCTAFGDQFSNLTPGSIHDIVDPPSGEDRSRGEWVQGVGDIVLVLYHEFKYID